MPARRHRPNKIALLMSRMGPDTPFSTLQALLDAYQSQLRRYESVAAQFIA